LNRVKSVIIFILLLPAAVSGQPAKKFTLEIFELGISTEIEKFFYLPDVNRNFQFIFVVNGYGRSGFDTDKNRFIVSVIKKTAEKNNIRYSFVMDSPETLSNDSVYYMVKVSDINLETKYPKFKKNRFLGDKTLERNVTSNINVDMHSSDNKFAHKNNIVLQYSDEIDYDSYESYESLEYDFTKGRPPKVNALESILFPALLVAISTATTILFFTIRSK